MPNFVKNREGLEVRHRAKVWACAFACNLQAYFSWKWCQWRSAAIALNLTPDTALAPYRPWNMCKTEKMFLVPPLWSKNAFFGPILQYYLAWSPKIVPGQNQWPVHSNIHHNRWLHAKFGVDRRGTTWSTPPGKAQKWHSWPTFGCPKGLGPQHLHGS